MAIANRTMTTTLLPRLLMAAALFCTAIIAAAAYYLLGGTWMLVALMFIGPFVLPGCIAQAIKEVREIRSSGTPGGQLRGKQEFA